MLLYPSPFSWTCIACTALGLMGTNGTWISYFVCRFADALFKISLRKLGAWRPTLLWHRFITHMHRTWHVGWWCRRQIVFHKRPTSTLHTIFTREAHSIILWINNNNNRIGLRKQKARIFHPNFIWIFRCVFRKVQKNCVSFLMQLAN